MSLLTIHSEDRHLNNYTFKYDSKTTFSSFFEQIAKQTQSTEFPFKVEQLEIQARFCIKKWKDPIVDGSWQIYEYYKQEVRTEKVEGSMLVEEFINNRFKKFVEEEAKVTYDKDVKINANLAFLKPFTVVCKK